MPGLRTRGTAVIVSLLVVGAIFLLWLYWPLGSPNMLVASDGTRIRVIQVENQVGYVLWRVTSPVGRMAEEIGVVRYGAVPSGFRQEVPVTGSPRPFVVDEVVEVHVISEHTDMAGRGHARGPASFSQVVWFNKPAAVAPSAPR